MVECSHINLSLEKAVRVLFFLELFIPYTYENPSILDCHPNHAAFTIPGILVLAPSVHACNTGWPLHSYLKSKAIKRKEIEPLTQHSAAVLCLAVKAGGIT